MTEITETTYLPLYTPERTIAGDSYRYSCACATSKSQARTTIRSLCAQAKACNNDTYSEFARSEAADWTGRAGENFRRELTECKKQISAADAQFDSLNALGSEE